jgi:integrase
MAKPSRPAGLTVLALKALKPRAAAYEVKDDAITGCYVQVWPSGATSYILRYRFRGKSKKLVIGKFNPDAGGLAEVRRAAREAQNSVVIARCDHAGKLDPVAARRAEKDRRAEAARAHRETAQPARDLVEKVVHDFIAQYAKPHNKDWHGVERMLQKEIVGRWAARRLGEISASEVREALREIKTRAPIGANRVHASFRKLCNWALEEEIIRVSPVEKVRALTPEKGRARERVLSDLELRTVWRAASTLGFPFGPIFQLLILTGQRRGEVAGGCWGEFDLSTATWVIPAERTKNGLRHSVPLSPPALSILSSLPRFKRGKGETDFVFSPWQAAPSGFSRVRDRLDAAILDGRAPDADAPPMPPWVVHDIRRSVASGMARLGGTPLHVIERCLNHVSGSFGGIVGVYQRHSFSEEMRVAEELWGRHIEALVRGEPAQSLALTARPWASNRTGF